MELEGMQYRLPLTLCNSKHSIDIIHHNQIIHRRVIFFSSPLWRQCIKWLQTLPCCISSKMCNNHLLNRACNLHYKTWSGIHLLQAYTIKPQSRFRLHQLQRNSVRRIPGPQINMQDMSLNRCHKSSRILKHTVSFHIILTEIFVRVILLAFISCIVMFKEW